MIDPEKLKNAPFEASPDAPDSDIAPSADFGADLKRLPLEQLLALRERVNEALPASSLKEMNLEEEVLLLYFASKSLLHRLINDVEVPANQKAQVANTVAANLQQLVKMQLSLYTSERVKALEAALTRALKTLPTEAQVRFFDEYERAYAAIAPTQASQAQSLSGSEP